ncbi:MAG: NAD(P)/FAD-dependent oxidoreductase [Candidatus Aenigmarchaeota archaeon]|nr:NAD(P)/FAD-dependent oxidoreductase [Candidatus Aenigmarchaeota archaeon]
MTEYDLVVIGAGSAGLNTAIQCSQSGLNVAVIEEHKKIGFPRHCSGLYSTRFLTMMDVGDNFYEHEVSGAKFHSPSGRTIDLMRKERVAFVINRELLDAHLGNVAKENGVEIFPDTKVLDFTSDENSASVATQNKIFNTKLICGADGSNSFVAKKLGFAAPKKLNGIMAITNEQDNSNCVDLFFDNKLYPGFFAWKIPRGKTTEYGIAGDIGPANVNNFNNFLSKFGVDKYELSSGVIPYGFQKSYSNRILLVGDAASQVKPLTGGGVIYGMICSRIAAQVFTGAVSKNKFDEKSLSSYEKMWRNAIGRGIKRGLAIRKFYSGLSNKNIELAFRLLNNKITKNIFEKYGDMEFFLERRPHDAVVK